MIYFFFWLLCVCLAFAAGYRVGFNDAEYVQRTFAGFDRAVLSLRARGFRR
ncbi:hypothetical protein [Humibacter sp.]|uniref:hypothetical protein n=1 Tax=Humibacter sp. TaxID=1940291 RepID=UPI003F80CF0F